MRKNTYTEWVEEVKESSITPIKCKNSPVIFDHFVRIMFTTSVENRFRGMGFLPRPKINLNVFGKHFHLGLWKRTLVTNEKTDHLPGDMYNES